MNYESGGGVGDVVREIVVSCTGRISICHELDVLLVCVISQVFGLLFKLRFYLRSLEGFTPQCS